MATKKTPKDNRRQDDEVRPGDDPEEPFDYGQSHTWGGHHHDGIAYNGPRS